MRSPGRHGLAILATNDGLSHPRTAAAAGPLMTCIRERPRCDSAGFLLEQECRTAPRRALQEMARSLHGIGPCACPPPGAVADLPCSFDLTELAYRITRARLSRDPDPSGASGGAHLEGAAWRYPQGVPEETRAVLRKSSPMNREARHRPHFLTIHDIIRYCAGGGVPADPLPAARGFGGAIRRVCFVWGSPAVDPAETPASLRALRSRTERRSRPDIDVDLSTSGGDEVIQHIYQKYGLNAARRSAPRSSTYAALGDPRGGR